MYFERTGDSENVGREMQRLDPSTKATDSRLTTDSRLSSVTRQARLPAVPLRFRIHLGTQEAAELIFFSVRFERPLGDPAFPNGSPPALLGVREEKAGTRFFDDTGLCHGMPVQQLSVVGDSPDAV